jgi:hypothetical protein
MPGDGEQAADERVDERRSDMQGGSEGPKQCGQRHVHKVDTLTNYLKNSCGDLADRLTK